MSNIIYLSIKGKIQGLISEGCGSYASIGNKYQICLLYTSDAADD